MPSVNYIQFQMEPLFESPYYGPMIARRNAFRAKSGEPPYTPQSLAKEMAVQITSKHMLADPVIVGELFGPQELYRGHDGGKKTGRLGMCWFDRALIENLWLSTASMASGQNRQSHFRQLMRACNLVRFEWNAMTDLVGMRVPKGERIVAVAGDGSWQAMVGKKLPRADDNRPGAVAKDLKRQLVTMAKEPTTQYIVPLFDDRWVQDIPQNSGTFPLLP